MNLFILLSTVLLSPIWAQSTPTFDPADKGLNSTQLLDKYKYAYQVYPVKTTDNYELIVIRILPKNPTGPGAGKVVFLNHGSVATSDIWLFLGPGYALAYLLSDAGYDVWLQNNRGNGISMGGGPTGSEFWNFGVDEMGKLDTPPAIDIALATTKKPDLIFIGHSEGCTMYAIMCLERPEYVPKVSKFIGLSPLFIMKFPSITNLPAGILNPIGTVNPINFDLGGFYAKLARNCLLDPSGLICYYGYQAVFGISPNEINPRFLRIILPRYPSSASAKTIIQVVQWYGQDDIKKFNYGPNNIAHYNSTFPPIYNMSLVAPNTPKYIYYGTRDNMIPPANNRYIIPRMKCVIQSGELPYAFGDTVIGLTAKDKVNLPILNILTQTVAPCS